MLRYYRTRAGMTTEALGQRIHMSGSLIRKIEDGSRTPSAALAEACEHVPELECNGALTRLHALLSEHLRAGGYPVWFADWPRREALARRLRSFELAVVPGLLQTEAYARAVLATGVGVSDGDLDVAVAARMERQQILNRDDPPDLWVIVDEAVLRRPVGGSAVMREQLEYLAGAARRPNVVIQVIPAATGAHQGLNGGAFAVADFDGSPSVAYMDSALSGTIVEDAEEVDELALTWDTLGIEALPRVASLSLIEEVAKSWI
jgi:transcriptional regulator with XRE-family HTH domain